MNAKKQVWRFVFFDAYESFSLRLSVKDDKITTYNDEPWDVGPRRGL